MNDIPLARGDVVLVNLDPVVGHENGQTRPAVIIQNDVGNEFSPTIIVASVTGFSARKARFPICAVVDVGQGGLDRRSIINAAQIRTIDRRRVVRPPLGRLPRDVMGRVDDALRISLEL